MVPLEDRNPPESLFVSRTGGFFRNQDPGYFGRQSSPRSPFDLRPTAKDEDAAEVYIKREKDLDPLSFFVPRTAGFFRNQDPGYFGRQSSPRSPFDSRPTASDEEAEVYIKREKDLDDELIIRTQSTSLPNLSHPFLANFPNDMHPHDDRIPQTRSHMSDSGLVAVRDEDRMSIQQESHFLVQSRENENVDSESDSTVVTIRNLRHSPLSQHGVQGLEQGDFDVARTAEYQRALFGMLEETCRDAARRYWHDVVSQRRFCLPISDPRVQDGPSYAGGYSHGSHSPLQPIRRHRIDGRFTRRHHVDPYPQHHNHSRLPFNRGLPPRRYDLRHPFREPSGDGDTRMSLSPSESMDGDIGNNTTPPTFLALISKITNHLWRTERVHPVAPYRAEFLTARKCWDIWRTAEVIVCARDELISEGDHDSISVAPIMRRKDEVIGIVEAAGELCEILGDEEGRRSCEELILSWMVDDIEEGEIVE